MVWIAHQNSRIGQLTCLVAFGKRTVEHVVVAAVARYFKNTCVRMCLSLMLYYVHAFIQNTERERARAREPEKRRKGVGGRAGERACARARENERMRE